MAPTAELQTFVSDSLTKLVGGSDPTMIDFVIATASSSKSPSQLSSKLKDMLESSEAEITKFSDDLFRRSTSKPSDLPKFNTTTPAKSEKKRYAFVPPGQDDISLPPQQSKKIESEVKSRKHKHKEKDRHHERRRKKREEDFEDRWGDQSEEEVEEEFTAPRKRVKHEHTPTPSHSDDSEREREKDRKELRELEERLKTKGNEHIGHSGPTKEVDINEIRTKARQKYLRDREVLKVSLLQKQVEEEEREERDNPDLTERELAEFKANRELLASALDRLTARDKAEDRTDFYIPEAGENRSETLNKRVKEREGVSEVQLWEEEQTARAKVTTGLLGANRVIADDYDYVFDEASAPAFLNDGQIPGTVNKELLQFQANLDAAMKKEATLQESRKRLPMYAYKEQLLEALKEHQVIVLVGETGSGKSTQVPQFLLEADPTKRGCVSQPRRLAAMSLAARVAEENGSRLGGTVGYTVRFESKCDPEKTKIKYLTEGILLREMLSDPTLSQYDYVMLDEAHERTVNTDVLLAFIKDLLPLRDGSSDLPKLTLIIASATMNAERFSHYMYDAAIFNVPGRMFPVTKNYLTSPEANYLSACVSVIFQIHISQPLPGDILVFMTGEEDIEECAEQVEETMKKLGNRVKPMIVTRIYSALNSSDQQKIFEPTPPGCRKVVIGTNICETSVTIDGVVYVIDPGLAKEMMYQENGVNSLQVTPISRAAAEQRAGRAGRTMPGQAFRLFTRYNYSELDSENTPEILRQELTSTVLQLKVLGIDNLLEFDLIDKPSPQVLIKSLETLYILQALNSEGKVTRIGRQMVELPTHPRLSAAIIGANRYSCVKNVLIIASMLEESASLWIRPKDQKTASDVARQRFTHKEGGDHLTLMNVYNAWVETGYDMVWCRENFLQYKSLMRARLVFEQFSALCEKVEIDAESSTTDHVPVIKALLSGFASSVATLMRDGLHYRVVKSNMQVKIHPSSVLANLKEGGKLPKAVMFHELVITSAEWMRNCAPIDDLEWLKEASPHFWKSNELDKLSSNNKMPKGKGAPAIKAN